MTPPKIKASIPRFALTVPEAAASLGIGESSFRRHVRPHIRLVREESLVLVPCSELARWVEECAEHTIDEEKGGFE